MGILCGFILSVVICFDPFYNSCGPMGLYYSADVIFIFFLSYSMVIRSLEDHEGNTLLIVSSYGLSTVWAQVPLLWGLDFQQVHLRILFSFTVMIHPPIFLLHGLCFFLQFMHKLSWCEREEDSDKAACSLSINSIQYKLWSSFTILCWMDSSHTTFFRSKLGFAICN